MSPEDQMKNALFLVTEPTDQSNNNIFSVFRIFIPTEKQGSYIQFTK